MANITSIFVFMLCGWCKNCKDKTNSLFTSCFFSTFFCAVAVLLCKVGFCILAQEMAGPAIRNSGKKSNTIEGDKKNFKLRTLFQTSLLPPLSSQKLRECILIECQQFLGEKGFFLFWQTLWYNVVFVPYLFTSHEKKKTRQQLIQSYAHTHSLFHSILVSFEIYLSLELCFKFLII